MTLNSNFAGPVVLAGRSKLTGSERGLDALIGLVILLSQALVGFLTVSALFIAGSAEVATNPSATDSISVGFALALFGSSIIVAITLIVYLVRIATGRASWRAPLVGAILMTVVLIIGYAIMASGS
ncbi:MAG: hypothetical protein H7226_09020 [Salinibacterium sp.]|nr:hypothetical protein [Salinibacterium sp.]